MVNFKKIVDKVTDTNGIAISGDNTGKPVVFPMPGTKYITDMVVGDTGAVAESALKIDGQRQLRINGKSHVSAETSRQSPIAIVKDHHGVIVTMPRGAAENQRRLILGPGAVGLPKSKVWFPVTELTIEGEGN